MRLLTLLIAIVSVPALGKIPVVTTTTDLAWAARRIGGDAVEVKSLLSGRENPHYLDASPAFIRAVANAKVVCFVGLDLEVGWLPKVLARSGNPSVEPGGKGHCETGRAVKALEVPQGPIDRSMGDVHPSGNPHFWLSPSALAEAGTVIRDTLMAVAPESAAVFHERYAKMKQELTELQSAQRARLEGALARNAAPHAVEYHKEFTYFFDAYGIQSFGSIEEKPGVPPSAGRIAEMALSSRSAGVEFAIAAEYSPRSTVEKFRELSGIPVLIVPTSLAKDGPLSDYAKFQEHLVTEILRTLTRSTSHAPRPANERTDS